MIALLVLVQSRCRVAAAFPGVVFVSGPMWLAPRGQFLELGYGWWQAADSFSYGTVRLAHLTCFAASRPRSERPL